MNSRELWNRFIAHEYAALVKLARMYCREPGDLVSHTYLRCIDKSFPEKPRAYFNKAMYIEATRGKFKKVYRIPDLPILKEPEAVDDLTRAIQLETIELLIDRLAFFDRELFRKYLEGYKISEISRESGIEAATLYQSIQRSKQKIKDAIRNTPKKNGTPRDL